MVQRLMINRESTVCQAECELEQRVPMCTIHPLPTFVLGDIEPSSNTKQTKATKRPLGKNGLIRGMMYNMQIHMILSKFWIEPTIY